MAVVEGAERLVGEPGSVELLKADAGTKLRAFRMVAYTGAEFSRWYGRTLIDIEGLTVPKRLPILLNHSEGQVAGYATAHEITAKGLVISGSLLSGEAGPRVAQMSDDGFPLTASLGVNITATEELEAGKSAVCNGKSVEGPCTIWRKATLFETSFVTSNPADKATSAAALTQESPMKLEDLTKAHPDLVKSIRDAAATTEREALMARLGALLKAIPGRAEFVLAQFSVGADVNTAKAALCDVLQAEATAAASKPAPTPASAGNPVLDALKQKAGNPGLGFDGVARENASAEQLAALPPLERAKAEFAANPDLAQFTTIQNLAACYRAEAAGQIRGDTITRAAGVMTGGA